MTSALLRDYLRFVPPACASPSGTSGADLGACGSRFVNDHTGRTEYTVVRPCAYVLPCARTRSAPPSRLLLATTLELPWTVGHPRARVGAEAGRLQIFRACVWPPAPCVALVCVCTRTVGPFVGVCSCAQTQDADAPIRPEPERVLGSCEVLSRVTSEHEACAESTYAEQVGELGRGLTANVFRATDHRDGATVALKRMPRDYYMTHVRSRSYCPCRCCLDPPMALPQLQLLHHARTR